MRHVSYVWEYPRLSCLHKGRLRQVTPSAAYYSCRPLPGSPPSPLQWTPIHSTLTPCPLSRATPDDLICQPRRRTLYIPEFPLQWRDSGVLDQSSVKCFSEMVWCFVFLNHFGFVLADLKSGLWRLAWLARRVRGDLPLPSALTLYTLLYIPSYSPS